MNRFLKYKSLNLAILLLVVFIGCKKEVKQIDAQSTMEVNSFNMVNSLKTIAEIANPYNNYMLNEARAAYNFRGYKKNKNNPQAADLFFKAYLEELINAGFVDKAISEIETLFKDFTDTKVTKQTKKYYDLLALAYAQKGEEENCVHHHTTKSCIIPIEKEGIHKNRVGSVKAIAVYTKILNYFPNDLQSRWFLNIAYMTIGEYPNKVPKRWLIPNIDKSKKVILPEFTDFAMRLGVNHTGLAGGVIVDDFNNDGYLDIMASSYGLKDQLKFTINNGNSSFKDVTKEANLVGLFGGLNMVHADYNNDGFIDVFVLRGAWLGDYGEYPNSLLRNNGDNTFTDVTKEAGVLSFNPTQTASWGDFNNDGYIDLFIGNESNGNPHPCELFVNNGDGKFKEISQQVGISVVGMIKGVIWGDINNDGLPDLYLSDLGGKNKLYLNKGGTSIEDWKFLEIAKISGVEEPYASFPAWFWDYNNDGFEDIFVSGYDSPRISIAAGDEAAAMLGQTTAETPRLYKNNGNNTFTDVSIEVGINWPAYTMGCNYGDLDNDGWLDFYLGTGTPNLNSIVPNRMFKNNKGEKFIDVTFQGGFGHIQKGHAIAFVDIDNDGDQDIYEVLGGAVSGDTFQNILLQNSGNKNNWITIKLEGSNSNKSAIGARIKVIVENFDGTERNIYATVSSGGSFGASSLQQEIGLGKVIAIKEIKIKWPDKNYSFSSYKNIPINSRIEIIQGKDNFKITEFINKQKHEKL